ncbi:MAG: hypothetical protein ACM3WV_07925 [Bacillota bacterium]
MGGNAVPDMARSFISAFSALVLGLLINRWLKRNTPQRLAKICIPFVEETLKSAGALFFVADLRLAHFLYGWGETVYEWQVNARIRWYVGVANMIIHFLFGWFTYELYHRYGSLAFAILIAGSAHYAWNFLVASVTDRQGA